MKRGITDISGQRFGKLIALEPTGESKHGSALWRCICDCGNERIAMLRSLKTRDATSCGCARSRLLDLTGKRFGKLTVVKRDSSKKTTTNCRWATLEQQNSNKRTNRTINGKTVMQWSKAFGLPYNTLRNRLARRGWNPELLVSDYPELSALWTVPYQTAETETNTDGE